jgi:hypothetical protein
VAARFAFREQLARLPDRQLSLGTRWPVLYVQAFQAYDGLWGGDRSLWRVNAMVEKAFRLRMLGTLSLRVMGGMADDTAPYPFLFNLRGTWSTRLPVATQNTFQTMRPNEFLADRYVAVFLQHSFGHLLFQWRKFRPVPSVVANAGWGSLAHPEYHRGYTFSTLQDGYYEAGLQLDGLLRIGVSNFGAGAYLRRGPNALPQLSDNLALKLSMTLGG